MAGRTVRMVRAGFQAVEIAVAGATLSAAATLRVSMASLKVMSTGACSSVAVSIERKAASASAVIGADGGVALVGTGRERPNAATITTIPTLASKPSRAATDRRASIGR